MADGRVIIETALDPAGIQRGMKQQVSAVKSGSNQMVNNVNKVKSSFNSLSATLTKVAGLVASVFAIAKLTQIGSEAVEMASDLQEVQNVVDTAFGDMTYKMENFANTAIETYGISKLAAKQMGSTFMAMSSGMGIAQDSASDMALSLTALSADMASFYNVSTDVSSTALKSIFTGETETLKKFGIVMTEVNMQEFARQQGIEKSIKNMTQAEKVQLRYNYVMSQTSLAQGDFAKTSDSWANQVRILKERWKEVLTVLGNGLMQVLKPLLQMLNQLASRLIVVANAMSKAFGFDMSDSTSSTASGIESISDATDDITDSTNDAVKAQKKLLGTYDDLNVISKDTDTSSSENTSGIGANAGLGTGTLNLDYSQAAGEVDKLADKFKNLAEQFKTPEKLGVTIGDTISNTFKKIEWNTIKSNANSTGQKLAEFLNGFNKTDAIATFGSTIAQTFNTMTSAISGFVTSFDFLQFGTAVSDGLNNIIEDVDWDTLSGTISSLIAGVFDFLSAIQSGLDINTISSAIVEFISGINWLDLGAKLVKFLVTGIATAMIKLPALLVTTAAKLVVKAFDTLITNISEGLKDNGNNIVKALFNGIKNAIKNIGTWVIENVGKPFINAFRNAFTGIVDVGKSIVATIKKVFTTLPSAIKTTFIDVVNAVKGVIGGIITAVVNVVSDIINKFKSIITYIGTTFSNLFIKGWQTVMTKLSGVIAGIKKIFSVPLNIVIGFINTVISGFEGAINFIIKCLNKLSFDVPDWVPGIGGETFGFNLKKVSFDRIPQLATGAVLPANKPFMAMVGDQKHGTNVEAPLDTIKQALIEALQSTGASSGDVVVQIDGREVFRAVQNQNAKYQKMYGKSLVM